MPLFRVTREWWSRGYYLIQADSEGEAQEKAQSEWEGGDDPTILEVETKSVKVEHCGDTKPEEEPEDIQYHCQNCGYVDCEDEFWSTDGSNLMACPKCGLSTSVFPV